jgi:hypothetical protein
MVPHVDIRVMLRFAVAFALLLAPVAGIAAPSPAPSDERARDGGVLDGRLVAVDYRRSTLVVDANHRRLNVNVMPTTSIQASDAAYHSIGDLKPGERVQILSSFAGGVYIAQIIRIL